MAQPDLTYVTPLRPNARPAVALAVAALAGGIAVSVAVAAAGWQVAIRDRIVPGVVVLGTPVGGLTRGEAADRLEPAVRALLERPLQLSYAGRRWDTTARALGLRLDPRGLANAAYGVGRAGDPLAQLREQLATLADGRALDATATTDRAVLEASLAPLAGATDRPPRDAHLALRGDGTLDVTSAQTSLTLDIAASADRVARALAHGEGVVELAVQEAPPRVTDDLVEPARKQLERLLGGSGPPLTLTFGRQEWPLGRAEVLRLLSLEGGTSAGQPVAVRIDERPLRVRAATLAKEIDQEVREARLNFVGGSLKVLRESRDGRQLDQAGTVALIKTRLLAGERTAALPVVVAKPKVSSENPGSLGIVELIERSSTSFAGSIPEKKANIKLAAERVNGVVVPPGGTFSFNQAVGPTTLDAGFQWGFGIAGGSDSGAKTVPSVAGGICQVVTTLFHPVFWAGYQLEERSPHLYWIPAYTSKGVVGLDATVDEESGLDFQWINPTQDYVLIQAASDEENVYFALYGKKPSWTVEVSNTVTNRRAPDPAPVRAEEPSLPWGRTLQVETAREGFDVLVTRKVTPKGGGEPRVLNLRSSYQPSRNVTLVGTAGRPAGATSEAPPARPQVPENRPAPDPAPKPVETGQPEPATGAAETAIATTPVPAPTPPPVPPPPLAPAGTGPRPTQQAPARATPPPTPTRGPTGAP